MRREAPQQLGFEADETSCAKEFVRICEAFA